MQNFGAVPVLYASQWFLTIFSCPFPATFSCRVIDVMLTEHSPNIMLRAALAVLAECEEDLLQRHDFEDLITYLKVSILPACISCFLLTSFCCSLCNSGHAQANRTMVSCTCTCIPHLGCSCMSIVLYGNNLLVQHSDSVCHPECS